MADRICQKIIVNLDIPMSIGRIAAQAAHASWLSVLNHSEWVHQDGIDELRIKTNGKPDLHFWLKESFTKVMLRGFGDDMLLELKSKAEQAGLSIGLMEEDGHLTALAIGPNLSEDIDKITKGLHLL